MDDLEGLAAVAAAASEGVSAPAAINNTPAPEAAPVAQPTVDLDALRREGAAAERSRLMALDNLALPGCEAIITAAKESGATADATAMEMVQHLKATGAVDVNKSLADAAETVPDLAEAPRAGAHDAPAVTTAGLDADSPEFDAAVKAEWDADAKVRAEFSGGFGSYKSWRKLDARKAA